MPDALRQAHRVCDAGIQSRRNPAPARSCWSIGLPSEQDFLDKVLKPAPEALGLSGCNGKEQDKRNKYYRRNDRNEPNEEDNGCKKYSYHRPGKYAIPPVWFHVVTWPN